MSVPERVGALWAFRAGGEREATTRFARIADELSQVSAERVVIDMAAQAAEDERRHEALCRELALAYGVTPTDEPRVATPVGRKTLSQRDGVLAEVVSLCCIGETLATVVLATTLEATTADDVHNVVHEILRDEVNHSRLGWAHLMRERELGHGDFLSAYLPRMLDAGFPSELFGANPSASDAEAPRAFGILPRSELLSILRATMQDVILPGFERARIDVGPARAALAARGTEPRTAQEPKGSGSSSPPKPVGASGFEPPTP